MKKRVWQISLLVVSVFFLISLFGGSAVYYLFEGADELDISGAAPITTTPAHSPGANWTHYGGDEKGQRYSASNQINTGNVDQLEIVWAYRTDTFSGREHLTHRASFEATPILVENTLVFCTPFNEVIALDPTTGAEHWRYDPEVDLNRHPGNGYKCRGVAYWQGDTGDTEDGPCASRIFMGTVDARLVAIDARTGTPCLSFGEQGQIRLDTAMTLNWAGEYQITSAPTIIGDTVVTGSSIGDNSRTDAPSGVVRAFDARTGQTKWQFDPIPRSATDPAFKSWGGESAMKTGHANVWSTMSVDTKRGLIFLPTSSPSPDFYGGMRPGDNRYSNSIVALKVETGDVAWHFQTVHHDVWDYDIPSQPGVYTVWREGTPYDVIAVATKTGHVFVLNRETGTPFLPVEERPVPQNGARGEALSPTQPVPMATPALIPDKFDPSDAFGVTLWDKMACENTIRRARFEGLFTPPSEQGTILYPFTGGGANWGSTAYDERRNLLIVNMSNIAHLITLVPKKGDDPAMPVDHAAEYGPMTGTPFGMTREVLLSPLGLPCSPPPWGILAAVDLNSGQIVWRRTIGTTEDLAPMGIALKLGTPNLGGPITTAGNVTFIAATMDNYLRAFNSETGKELWKGRLPAGGQATPMTYEVDGRQYVVIASGGHGETDTRRGDYVIAFSLPER